MLKKKALLKLLNFVHYKKYDRLIDKGIDY